ncbi:TIGR03364 family FAD-dependent oxidoreductase [Antrihabitans cavernicola]|uniref:TIGR03364 family FAD-dependent oxidoreductase n=1 Tax=Antrihabitans cavernicola TaxID=2495913 RepID=A0A5A7SAR2_9NOCA|nr:TIGR03364 family FAD-dependent oxidoreductase [Spelaeibacter cavernicola]KAA0023016.1 TIGR03364 family FAD-dependent oxidoreductase [Spelaeibacter cavernicola]
MENNTNYDVVVVGSGIVGLAHAYHALSRGLRVAVVDHADGVTGASVQNFGHACITAQSGPALRYGRAGREHWLDLSRKAGFWSARSGTLCVARHDDEQALIDEFASERGAGEVELLDRAQILERLPIRPDGVTGGMYLPNDIQVDPRTAAPSIARWLESSGVDFYWRTAATSFDSGVVHTTRGDLRAGTIFVTVNYDIDRLFPEYADRDDLQRCRLHMLRAEAPLRFALPTPLFTGWSLVRYSGFDNLASKDALLQRLRSEYPDYVDIDLHQMYTPQSDGSILVGDTHAKDVSTSPFQSEKGFAVLIAEAEHLFGVPLTVTERWQGVYSSAPNKEFLIEEPLDGVHVVTVTTGIGMTTSMGLALESVDRAFAHNNIRVSA